MVVSPALNPTVLCEVWENSYADRNLKKNVAVNLNFDHLELFLEGLISVHFSVLLFLFQRMCCITLKKSDFKGAAWFRQECVSLL